MFVLHAIEKKTGFLGRWMEFLPGVTSHVLATTHAIYIDIYPVAKCPITSDAQADSIFKHTLTHTLSPSLHFLQSRMALGSTPSQSPTTTSRPKMWVAMQKGKLHPRPL